MTVSLPVRTEGHVQAARQGGRSASPSDVALALLGRDYLSYSAIRTYQTCPLRFFFQYVARLEPEFTPSSLIFGGAVHTAIEEHYRALLEGRAAPGLDELLETYDTAWQDETGRRIQFSKGETAESMRELAGRMLGAFRASELSRLDSDQTLFGVEEEFRAEILPGCPDLLGRVDLLVRGPRALRIVDFKTSRSAWGPAKIQEAIHQQLLYAQLVRPVVEACGDLPVQIEWIVLTKGKSPAVERHAVTPDPDLTAWTNRMVASVWRAIAGEQFYPTPSTLNCVSCTYQTPCSTWEG